jgi:hypothetical protein
MRYSVCPGIGLRQLNSPPGTAVSNLDFCFCCNPQVISLLRHCPLHCEKKGVFDVCISWPCKNMSESFKRRLRKPCNSFLRPCDHSQWEARSPDKVNCPADPCSRPFFHLTICAWNFKSLLCHGHVLPYSPTSLSVLQQIPRDLWLLYMLLPSYGLLSLFSHL